MKFYLTTRRQFTDKSTSSLVCSYSSLNPPGTVWPARSAPWNQVCTAFASDTHDHTGPCLHSRENKLLPEDSECRVLSPAEPKQTLDLTARTHISAVPMFNPFFMYTRPSQKYLHGHSSFLFCANFYLQNGGRFSKTSWKSRRILGGYCCCVMLRCGISPTFHITGGTALLGPPLSQNVTPLYNAAR